MATTARRGVPRDAARDFLVGMGITAGICGAAIGATSLALEETAPRPSDRTAVRSIATSAPDTPLSPVPLPARMDTYASSPSHAQALPATDIPTGMSVVAAVPFADLYAGQGVWVRTNAPGDPTPRDEDSREYLGKMVALQHRRRLSAATTRDPYQASLNLAVYLANDATPGARDGDPQACHASSHAGFL
jgi:hypothetical protein